MSGHFTPHDHRGWGFIESDVQVDVMMTGLMGERGGGWRALFHQLWWVGAAR